MVSIIVPVYNMGHMLPDCIDSILAQDYIDYEVIIVDDGSTDGSADLCDAQADRDARISVLHTSNHGAGGARNEGIRIAHGDYAYFPDADDVMRPGALSALVRGMESMPGCDLAVAGFDTVDDAGRLVKRQMYEEGGFAGETLRASYSECAEMYASRAIAGAAWNKLFRIDVIRQFGVYFPDMRRYQDEAFIARYMSVVRGVKFVSHIVYEYRTWTMTKVWKKCTARYVQDIVELDRVRRETVESWNELDYKTHDKIRTSYVYMVCNALTMAYSPKSPEKYSDKLEFVSDVIDRTEVTRRAVPQSLTAYQRLALKLMHRPGRLLMGLIRAKVCFEKYLRPLMTRL